MKKMKICYLPFDYNLKSPGDRRRTVFWAQKRGHEVTFNLEEKCDLIVVTEKSNFRNSQIQKNGAPVIFDLIDGYLSPENSLVDFMRGFTKKLDGQISGSIMRFSKHVAYMASLANAVVCSSVEQRQIISKLNNNTHIILDSHSEIPLLKFREKERDPKHLSLFWEGLPYTAYGLKLLNPTFEELNTQINLTLNCVTDNDYYRLLGKYWKISTLRYLKRQLTLPPENINLYSWTIKNLISIAYQSNLALLPISTTIPMQRLKPENRLLIMWKLGLPCLTSDSPAYARIEAETNVSIVCKSQSDWQESIHQYMDADFANTQVIRGQQYILNNHNDEVLLSKWDSVAESVL